MGVRKLVDRTKYIGASEIKILMDGDADSIHNLWMIKTGKIIAPDLSNPDECDNWFQVRLGIFSEEFNLRVRQEQNPEMKIVPNQEPKQHPNLNYLKATPDAYGVFSNEDCVLDAKHTHPFNGNFENKEERIKHSYYWQMQMQMLVAIAPHSFLCPIYGNNLGPMIYIAANYFDQELILNKARDFWNLVRTDTAPPTNPKPILPSIPQEYRKIKFEETNFGNEVEAHAETWIANKSAVAIVKNADAAIKKMIPDDVNLAEGYGIKVTRTKPSKSRPHGTLSIKEIK